MKKLLLLSAAMLTFGVAVASAQGTMNLSWGACRTANNNATATTNNRANDAFTNASTCDDPANEFVTQRLVCSFRNDTPMLAWGGTQVQVDIQVGNPGAPLPDYWAFGSGGCREGGLSTPTVAVNGTGCTNPYTIVPLDPGGQSDFSSLQANAATGRIVYRAQHVRNTTQVDLPVPAVGAATGGYTANNLALASQPGFDVCGDCLAPACVVLNEIQYFSLTETRVVVASELRNNVTWNGGNPSCPGSTPTRNATWGQVKALYR